MTRVPSPLDERLFRGLSVYQDVVIAGKTVRSGHRDCVTRWQVLNAHLPPAGTFLDVGSNFGWFGLQLVQSRPNCVVASVEADERSAAVQRVVLESNAAERIALLTHHAGATLARRFQTAGPRFNAVLCLSVLHWMADHREFLRTLGAIADRIFLEQPDPREAGAGVESIRREIGPIGPYLADLFPHRPSTCLARLPSHRNEEYLREIWLVAEPAGSAPQASPGLDAAALLDLAPGWPARSWWRKELETLPPGEASAATEGQRVLFAPAGLRWAGVAGPPEDLAALRRAAGRIPEHRALPLFQSWYRHWRRRAGNLVRRLLGK
jgi:hypothetical protein